MRRMPLLILLALVALAVPAVAATRSEHKFTMSFSKTAVNAPTGITFKTDRYAYVAPPLGQPASLVSKTVFVMAPGTRTDTRAVATCTLAKLKANSCPAASKVGNGTATAITGLQAVDPLNFAVTVYASKGGLLTHLAGGGTVTDIPLTMKGNTITADLPRTCSPGGTLADNCSNGDTVIKTLSVTIKPRKKGSRAFIRTPRKCPASGVWTNKAIYTFANGDTETQVSTSKCRGGK